MDFYTKESSNLVFTVKSGSDVSDLIKVTDIAKTLESKNLEWVEQVKEDKDYCTILVLFENPSDERLYSYIDICHQSELSYDCSEVYSVFNKSIITVRRDRELSEMFCDWCNNNGYSATLADRNSLNGNLAGSKEFIDRIWGRIWDRFYDDNEYLLAPNNVCVIREKILTDMSGGQSQYSGGVTPSKGGYNISWEYWVVSRYNYTQKTLNGQDTPVLFITKDLKKAIDKAISVEYFNKQLKACVSCSIEGRPEAVAEGLRMF